MARASVSAIQPDLVVEAADPYADEELLTAIADWCDRYTPLVALDPPDGLLLDISGCAHLFDGEAGLLVDLTALKSRPDHQIAIIATGSQGEPSAALGRMANGKHRHISIKAKKVPYDIA